MAERNEFCRSGEIPPSQLVAHLVVWGAPSPGATSSAFFAVEAGLTWNGEQWEGSYGPLWASLALTSRDSNGWIHINMNWRYEQDECEWGGGSDYYMTDTCTGILAMDGGSYPNGFDPVACFDMPGVNHTTHEIGVYGGVPRPYYSPPQCYPLPDECPDCPTCGPGFFTPDVGAGVMAGAMAGAAGVSAYPIRYATGEVIVRATDIAAGGFGEPWGHTRSFVSRMSANQSVGNGFNWQVAQWPFLVVEYGGTVIVQGEAQRALWFDKVGGGYVPRYGVKRSLEKDGASGPYRLTDLDGTVTEFDGTTGMFRRRTSPGGQTIEVTATGGNGYNVAQVQRSSTSGGVTTVEQLQYEHGTSTGDEMLVRVTLSRRVGAGDWADVSRAVYTYYGVGEPHGTLGDLKTATTQSWDGTAWADTGTTYYRYHKRGGGSSSSSSSSGPGGSGGPTTAHLLKYVVLPASYARLAADPGVSDPLTASDAQVALYADHYFEYDAQRRVTKEMVEGASRTFLFAYAQSGFADGYNSWKTKTTETLPDGNQNVVYANFAGQTMLKVFKSGTDEWCDFYKYSTDGLLILHASPAAVSGYDEQYADLLHAVSGNYEFLRDNDGLIRTYAHHAPTGFLAGESVQKGELGASIKLREYEYVACCAGGSSSSSSSSSSGGAGAGECVYRVSKETVYPSDTDQTKTIVTTYSYTYHPGTCQVKERVTTLPTVPTDQNGSGVAATRRDAFDIHGNLTWHMDERGFLTRNTYDVPTGALVRVIQDVDTSLVTDEPAGWATPGGGGLHLVTDYEHDARGRVTQSLGPAHTVDLGGTATAVRRAAWTVSLETASGREVRTGQGYATGSEGSYAYTLMNPVAITKTDLGGSVLEEIRAVRGGGASSSSSSSGSGWVETPLTSPGRLLASDVFPQSSYVRWTTHQYTDCCHLASTRVYHDIPALGAGAEGANYGETRFGYDAMKRRNRHESPGGTVTSTVFQARGLPVKTYVGTDDTGATASDPTGGGAVGNNMVLVSEQEYDGGSDGGNGYLTRETQYAGASDTCITSLTYDWRGRRTDTDGEVDVFRRDHYDNLGRVVKTERYDTTAFGNLIARSETKYDERGRAYRTVRYGVDPATGTVGNGLADNNWYDAARHPIKSLKADSKLFTKTVYDSLGRPTKRYVGYDLDETTYTESGTVGGDTILRQEETSYDAEGNVLQTTTRERYHNATGEGELTSPGGTQPKARVTYAALWHDPLGRKIAAADYGTNGGTALLRPTTVPSRSDSVLVTSMEYNGRGEQDRTTDPAGKENRQVFDDAGRRTRLVENYVDGDTDTGTADQDRTTLWTYTADGLVATLTAKNVSTGDQATRYVYGTTLSDSDVSRSDLLRAEIYPDSDDTDSPLGNGVDGVYDRIEFRYNRLGERKELKDQNGTVHAYDYDKLGRLTQDRVTALGSGVDGAVRRIATTYEVRGMRLLITSYDHATVGQGSVVNEVRLEYNAFGQLTKDYQSHGGAVNTSTTPKVQYAYANGSDNHVRPTGLTYPDGRVLTYGYGSTGGMNDAAGRVESLIDDDLGSTHLADYGYLGLGRFVTVDYTEPDLNYTLVDLSPASDPDTGDIYSGLDRFGRVKDSRWYDYGASADANRIKYGYDRAGNRLWRENVVADGHGGGFDELYAYDGLHRLKDMQRGDLNAGKTAVTNKAFAEAWSLDPTGNWVGYKQDANGNGTWDLDQSRTANKVNEIANVSETAGPSWVTPAYDPAGNMTTIPKPADPTVALTGTYDGWHRLAKVAADGITIAEYQYDGATRRTLKNAYASGVLSETWHLFYSGPEQWQVLEERLDSSSHAHRQLVWGMRYRDDLVLRDRYTNGDGTTDERLYATADAHWDVLALADTSGALLERYSYSAFGTPRFLTPAFASLLTSSFSWDILYAGYQWDTLISQYHVRHRVYSYTTGGYCPTTVLLGCAAVVEHFLDGRSLTQDHQPPVRPLPR